MFIHILWLIVGLALIIKGGDLFVSSSVRIAEMLRLPRVVIGSTLVSLATTTPELVVSITAGMRGESGLAVGNALGSCVCNISLILATMAVLRHIEVHPSVLKVPLLAMAGAGLLLFVITLNLEVSRWQGMGLLALGIGYFVYDFRFHKRDVDPDDIVEARRIEQAITAGRSWITTGWGTGLVFAAGAVLVICGSHLLVDSAVGIAEGLGVPSIVIGLSVVAIGTSLPELVTAITSARQNVSDLAVGNILGANIANLTLIIGSAASIQAVPLSRPTQVFSFPAMLLLMGMMVWMIWTKHQVTRREGVVLLVFYFLYLCGVAAVSVMTHGG